MNMPTPLKTRNCKNIKVHKNRIESDRSSGGAVLLFTSEIPTMKGRTNAADSMIILIILKMPYFLILYVFKIKMIRTNQKNAQKNPQSTLANISLLLIVGLLVIVLIAATKRQK